jgi:hypothetical protein
MKFSEARQFAQQLVGDNGPQVGKRKDGTIDIDFAEFTVIDDGKEYDAVSLMNRRMATALNKCHNDLQRMLRVVKLEHSRKRNLRNWETEQRTKRIVDNVNNGRDPYDGLEVDEDRLMANFAKFAKDVLGESALRDLWTETEELEVSETYVYEGDYGTE